MTVVLWGRGFCETNRARKRPVYPPFVRECLHLLLGGAAFLSQVSHLAGLPLYLSSWYPSYLG